MAMNFTEEQLNKLDKSFLVQLFLNQQEELKKLNRQTESLSAEIKNLNDIMQKMMEQLILAKKNRFGRSSEVMSDATQISFREEDGVIVFFNEAEAESDLSKQEPEDLERKVKTPKQRGKKESDMSGFKVNIIEHYMSEKELTDKFGKDGYKRLPDVVSKKYKFIPATVEVDEHHIGVYASKTEDKIIRAPHPKFLLHGSAVSASLAAAVMNGKYVNAVPLYRLEKEFERYGLAITRQNMANWMIRLGEEYISVLYDHLHKVLLKNHVIQADETSFLVNKDGRPAGTKSWMWVYRSGYLNKDRQIVLYDYQTTRNTSRPREFLKNFSGICVTDGYQVYHSLEKEKEDLTIAGCWVHYSRCIIIREKVPDTLNYWNFLYYTSNNVLILLQKIRNSIFIYNNIINRFTLGIQEPFFIPCF